MPSILTFSISILPRKSSPTLPMNAVFLPSFESIARTLHGAPPGFASKSIFPFPLAPASEKSTRSSPTATASNTFSILSPLYEDNRIIHQKIRIGKAQITAQ